MLRCLHRNEPSPRFVVSPRAQAISCGYCITRAHLGENGPAVIGVPILYLSGALLIDELLLRRAGLASATLLAAGVAVKLAALAYAWVFVLTSCRDERGKLAARWARLRFVADAFKLEDGEESAQRGAAAAVTAAAARAVPTRGGAPSPAAAASPASLATSAAIISAHADVDEAPPSPRAKLPRAALVAAA